jgi:magnesium transporter
VRTVLVHEHGRTTRAAEFDPAWLVPESGVVFWLDIEDPQPDDARLLRETLGFHELAVEDALSEIHHPKIEHYDKFLYLILHGIVADKTATGFCTQDIDFFLSANYLVTVHNQPSRSIAQQQEICVRHGSVLAEGPPALLHRIVDSMVDHYRPEVDRLEERLEELERLVFEEPRTNPLRQILLLKQDVASLRRIALPERDAIGRLARREFAEIPDALAYQFRDVYDHLVSLVDEAVSFQDRVTGLLDAYLSSQSNRLNQVMKVLTVISTIFMPLTVLTGMWGMNVGLPHFPGGDSAQFWWVAGVMAAASVAMLWVFRRMEWL